MVWYNNSYEKQKEIWKYKENAVLFLESVDDSENQDDSADIFGASVDFYFKRDSSLWYFGNCR